MHVSLKVKFQANKEYLGSRNPQLKKMIAKWVNNRSVDAGYDQEVTQSLLKTVYGEILITTTAASKIK